MNSTDIYAYTNPAFLVANINEFLKGYHEKKESCFFPVIYLVAPMVLSKKINRYFESTNKRTEFLNLIYRHPEITLELSKIINKTKIYSDRAIIFGSQLGIFEIDTKGYLSSKCNISKKKINEENMKYLKYANRLGYWLGSLDESEIFYNIGVLL